MRKHIIIIALLIAALVIPVPVHAGGVELPKDQPTIEALISLHKLIKKEEDKAMEKVTASYGEQSLVTKGAKAFNDVRTTLDTKLSDAHSYLVLGSALAMTGTDLYKLIRDYSSFTRNTVKYTFKKPQVAWYYTEANIACSREIKNIKKMYVTLSATGLNVMKASMDEKIMLINTLHGYINNIRGIIDSANLWCSIVVMGGFQYDYIWDILNSDVREEIAQGLINKWNNG